MEHDIRKWHRDYKLDDIDWILLVMIVGTIIVTTCIFCPFWIATTLIIIYVIIAITIIFNNRKNANNTNQYPNGRIS